MKRLARLFPGAAFLLVPVLSALAAAGDWPQWRGPNRDGISTETGLLKEWPKDGPPLAWKVRGLGSGYSTVSLVGNRIFTLGDKAEETFVIALNRADGKQVWATKLGKGGSVGWGNFEGPRSTPTVDGNLVFAIGQWGEVICLEADSGKELWRKDITSDFGSKRPEWGYAESPLVDGDQVVFTPGGPKGAIVALNKKTGELIWQSAAFKDAAHYSSLVIAEIAGIRQYVQLTDAHVVGIAPKDGKLLWRAMRRGATAVIPTPICFDDQVYVTSGYGIGCNLFKVTKSSDGELTAEQVYANKVMANHHGGVIKLGDYVYGHSDGKGWTCQELKTGNAAWQEKGPAPGKGSIAYADGHFYLRAEDGKGTVALIEATPDGYKEHGRFNQPERSDKNSWAHPVIAGGKLYLRDQDLLLCYDIKAK